MSDASKGTPTRSRNRLWITLGAVAVVLVVLVAGGLVWHRSPSFCGAVCHTPMKGYVDGYTSGDAKLLVTAHAEGPKGLSCLDCHEPELGQQVTEGVRWVSGDYVYPLKPAGFGTRAFCLDSGCHDEAKIISATANYGGQQRYNPHDPRHGKAQCGTCHSMHRVSTLSCNQCHKLKLPEGWAPPVGPGMAAK